MENKKPKKILYRVIFTEKATKKRNIIDVFAVDKAMAIDIAKNELFDGTVFIAKGSNLSVSVKELIIDSPEKQ